MAIIDKDIEKRSANEIKEARNQALLSLLEKWYTRRDSYWKQMSRLKIAKDMDRNLRDFHAIACAKGKRKAILSLWINGEDG